MKKRLITAFLAVLGLYIAVSVLLSIYVSTTVNIPSKWRTIALRRPFLIVEYTQTTVITEDGRKCAYNHAGEYIGHNACYHDGDNVQTWFIYNPFTTYTDDLSIRIDNNISMQQFTIDYWR